MMTILIPALIALLGVFLYGFAQNPKLVEIGRIAFAVGLFWTVAGCIGHTVSLLK